MTLKSNAEELALMAQEIGAEVIMGPVGYPSESGDIEVGGVDIGEYLYEPKGQEVIVIMAPLGPVQEPPVICGLCGTPYDGEECSTCKAEREQARRVIKERLAPHVGRFDWSEVPGRREHEIMAPRCDLRTGEEWRSNEEELACRFEPVLRFAKGENFFPMKVEGYVEKCSLHVMEGGRGQMLIPPPYVDLQTLAEFPSQRHYLVYANRRVANPEDEEALRNWIERQKTVLGPEFRQFLGDLTTRLGGVGIDLSKILLPIGEPAEVVERAIEYYGGIDSHPPTHYYRVVEDGGYTVVQYWFFYAYNDSCTTHGGVNDHEADWECVHLFFKAAQPVWATYSSHLRSGTEIGRPWDHVELEGDHPVVYVAAGSHANYHVPEEHLPDKAFVPGNVVVGGSSGTPWDKPEPMDRPWFTEFQGRWGEYESSDPRSKFVAMVGGPPTGPKFDRDGGIRKKWNRPAEYAGLIRSSEQHGVARSLHSVGETS